MVSTNDILTVDKTNKCIYCNVAELVVRIPMRYQTYSLLVIENQVSTLGIFDMYINNELIGGYMLAAMIMMDPSEIEMSTIDSVAYAVLTFNKGDTFIVNTDVVQTSMIAYSIFVEFMSLGNLPKFIGYKELAILFDLVGIACGVKFKVNHAVMETMWANQYRDIDDPNLLYRHTKMTKPGQLIGLNSVSHGPDSTTAKIAGSYFNDGLNAALVNPAEKHSKLEDLMRT